MKIKNLIFIILLSFQIKAQVVKNFDRTYGSTEIDKPLKVFFEGGKTYVFGTIHKSTISIGNITAAHGQSDYNLVIYNSSGVKIKDVCFGGDRTDSLINVFQKDSAFIMVGLSRSANGSGNKNAANLIIDNSTIAPINTRPTDGYAEIYMVSVDLDGDILDESSVCPTQPEYIDTDPWDLPALYAEAVTHSSLYVPYVSGPAGLDYNYYDFNFLIDIVGVEYDGNFIRVLTTESCRLQSLEDWYYRCNPHANTTSCFTQYTYTTNSSSYAMGAQLTEYSINADFSNYTIDKKTFTEYRTYQSKSVVGVSCPNGCSCCPHNHNYNTAITPYYYKGAMANFTYYNPRDFIGDRVNDAAGNYWYIFENIPVIYKSWYVNGKWVIGTVELWTYDPDGSASYNRAWPGKNHYMIAGYTYCSPNNYSSKPIDMFYLNNKYYLIIEDNPNASPAFNPSTPTPSGFSSWLYASYTRSTSIALTTNLPNVSDLWIVECNGAINTNTNNTIYSSPFNLSAPTRQASIRANNNIIYTSRSEIFDTNKIYLSLSTAASIQYDKHNPNKGGIDYWPVKFDLGQMKAVWDTTVGGTAEDLLSDIKIKDGVLVLTGKSKSGIGGDKTQTNFDSNKGDYWTINYCVPPTANFVSDLQVVNPGDLVTFTNLSIRATEFDWNFSDVTGSYDVNPVHYFYNPGLYSVTLKASNGNCISTTTFPNYILVNDYVGIEEIDWEKFNGIYPNPNNGEFYINPKAEVINVSDILGKSVGFFINDGLVRLEKNTTGMYFINYRIKDKSLTEKIIIK